jgi:hypothetical protein
MKELKKLVGIVTESGLKNLPLLNLYDEDKGSNLEQHLFLGIRNGEYSTDEDAENDIYGSVNLGQRYKMLKSRLKYKLLNHLFFLNFKDPEAPISIQYEHEILNYLHMARMLMKVNENDISEKLLLKCLRLSQDAEFTQYTVDCLELIRNIYSDKVRPKLFKKNKKELMLVRELLKQEQEAVDEYYYSRILLRKSVHSRKKNMENTLKTIAKLEKSWEKTQSFNIYDKFIRLKLWYLEIDGDFEKIIQFTSEIDEQFENNKVNVIRFDQKFIRQTKINAYLKAGKLDEGLMMAENYLKDFDPSQPTWFDFMDTYYLLSLHQKDYSLGAQLLISVFENPYYKKLSAESKDKWEIYRAYLYIVKPEAPIFRDFNYQIFYTPIPEFSKEKAGVNVAVLLLQFIKHLFEDDFEFLKSRIGAIDRYINRYCTDEFSLRIKYFYKLLKNIVDSEMNIYEVNRKSRYSFKQLQGTPVQGDASAEIEIIPYEHLWDIIISVLKKNYARL